MDVKAAWMSRAQLGFRRLRCLELAKDWQEDIHGSSAFPADVRRSLEWGELRDPATFEDPNKTLVRQARQFPDVNTTQT